MIAHTQPVDAEAVAEHARSEEMDLAARHLQAVVAAHVDVGEIGDEDDVVVAHRRAEEERPPTRQEQFDGREKARPAVVEPLFLGFSADDVAVLIEDGEGVAAFEHAQRPGGPLRVGENRELIVELQYVRHMRASNRHLHLRGARVDDLPVHAPRGEALFERAAADTPID